MTNECVAIKGKCHGGEEVLLTDLILEQLDTYIKTFEDTLHTQSVCWTMQASMIWGVLCDVELGPVLIIFILEYVFQWDSKWMCGLKGHAD